MTKRERAKPLDARRKMGYTKRQKGGGVMTPEAGARALYEIAFAGDSPRFADALFATYAPEHLRVIERDGRVASMLFSIPYPVQTAEGLLDARYLYAIATHPDYRSRGLARELIENEAAHHPIFLRPMSPSLFDFYAKVGMTPFSPMKVVRGEAATKTCGNECHFSAEQFLAEREERVPFVSCRMTSDFLAVAKSVGGMAGMPRQCAALYDLVGDTVIFKEWWGNPYFAPRIAAFLGAKHYELRYSDPDGTPFGVMRGLPQEALFLAAMD